ncbi:XRE family transcriptional regulator [Lentilactobacillus diolivorans]|uniref:LexA family protein n=1 Tax=Lentilactobacillus diolivorans TaxID=179838 RepID=UPI002468D97B|nr:XRE family transcriptional regulator [Lentilactobacillus diolivorans]MDH5106483.1 XRE family transcriptional regulator [Lentilactobacillus diolivorans]
MNLGSRIKELRTEKRMTQAELGRVIGVTKVSISGYENNTRQPDNSILLKLAGYFNVSTDYLLGKSNNKLSLSNGSAPVNFSVAKQSIPVYGMIHAGEPTFADQYIIGETPITDKIIDKYGRDNLFALQVDGDSMSKVIAPGFIAVFAKDCEVENGDICAVLVDGENATLKRFKETSKAVILEPESFNPIYKPLIFSKNIDQDFRILGKYVFATSLLQ